MNRHWVVMALGLAGGIALGGGLPPGPLSALGAAAFCGVLALVWTAGRMPLRDIVAVFGCCAAAGALLFHLSAPPRAGDDLSRLAVRHDSALCTLEGLVREAPALVRPDGRCRFELSVETVRMEGRTRPLAPSRCLVYCTAPEFLPVDGDRVRVTGRLDPVLSGVNHGLPSYEQVMRRRGVFTRVTAKPRDLQRVEAAGTGPWSLVCRLRQTQARAFLRALPESAAPFALGVWLGERSGLDRETNLDYVHSGTVHILSVSGIHVGLVYLALSFLVGMAVKSPKRRAVLVLVGVFVFALAAGARPATLRAAFMAAVVVCYDLFDREPDIPSALGISAVVLLAANASSLFDAGFVLSYTAMASLLLFQQPVVERLGRLPRWLGGAVATGVSAQLLTAPVAAGYFQVLPLAGLAANLVVVPVLGLVLWLCLAVSLLAPVLPGLALLPGHACAPPIAFIEAVVRWAGNMPGGHAAVPPPTLPALLCWAAACLFLRQILRARPSRRRNILAALVLFAAALFLWRPGYPRGTVDFLDVGHADAAFLMTPEGAAMLVDGGNRVMDADAGRDTVAPFLRAHGVRRLDAVAVTHADSDHIGGVFHIVENFPVGGVWLGPELEKPEALEDDLVTLCRDRGVPVHRAAAGEEIPLKGARVEVLHPPAGGLPGAEANDNSLALRVSWEGLSVLFAGDIEKRGELALAAGDCAAAVLKSPHHGSATSNSGALLRAVRPAAVVVSTRRTSRWRAVGAGVMETFAEQGIPVWRTDWQGGVRLSAEDGALVITGARERLGYTLKPPPGPGESTGPQ
ncbi:MAG TPA: DNA internalization-related competence protein ComEC/Rec2 [Candidatus Hydrogenedentes bacterium]|nr:DNA internalization-related competence protein ComEC/Rec2 [Candidatus Hydrogenedentota bacterium]